MVRNPGTLPDKIQRSLREGHHLGTFKCALKTNYKPNATIPILWIVLTKTSFILCNTHRTRGVTAVYPWSDINCVRKSDDFRRTNAIEVLHNDLATDNDTLPLPSEVKESDVDELIRICDEHIIARC
jgi:hypothetical protein